MQLTKNIFQNSAIFIEKKWVENQLWKKCVFVGKKNLIHLTAHHIHGRLGINGGHWWLARGRMLGRSVAVDKGH